MSEEKIGALTYDLHSTLSMIEDAKASGVLTFAGAGNARIVFESGEIIAASSTLHYPIGQALVAAGMVSQSLLDTVLAVQRRKKQKARLGAILVSLGVVNAETMRDALRRQWVDVLRDCLESGGGTFDFMQDNISDGDLGARFSVDELVKEAQGEAS